MSASSPSPTRQRRPRVVRVEDVAWISRGLVRIAFGGPELEGFDVGAFTDHYVKLHFPAPDADYGPPFDPAEIRATRPSAQWSRTRTYTVRAWDPERLRLTIDFVVHGTDGVAGPWAAGAQAGDVLQLVGPGGAYAPDPEVPLHLFVGDESALPAIAVALERLGPGATAHVLAQVPGPEHEIALASSANLQLAWYHDDVLPEAVRALELAPGEVQAFVHGEAAMVRAVRRHLLAERGLARERLSASGYWKQGRTDEGWREDKPEWNRLAEQDLAA